MAMHFSAFKSPIGREISISFRRRDQIPSCSPAANYTLHDTPNQGPYYSLLRRALDNGQSAPIHMQLTRAELRSKDYTLYSHVRNSHDTFLVELSQRGSCPIICSPHISMYWPLMLPHLWHHETWSHVTYNPVLNDKLTFHFQLPSTRDKLVYVYLI